MNSNTMSPRQQFQNVIDGGDFYKIGMKNRKEKAFADRVKDLQEKTEIKLAYKTKQVNETKTQEVKKQTQARENMIKKFQELEEANVFVTIQPKK